MVCFSGNLILFCGLVRNCNGFINKIKVSHALKKEGVVDGIIFSTWKGEVEKYSGLVKFLDEMDVVIVELDEPNLRLPGHIIHQMKTLFFGLDLMSEESLVLKLRPDLGALDHNIIKKAFIDYHKYSSVEGVGSAYKYKIVLGGGFIFQPFYLNDITFMGVCSELKKMVNMDLKNEIVYSNMAPEQWYHTPVFLSKFKLFDCYFRAQRGFDFNNPFENKKFYKGMLEDDFYLNVLYGYWSVLRDNYLSFHDFVPASDMKVDSLDGLFSMEDENIRVNKSVEMPYFKTLRWLDSSIKVLDSLEYKRIDPFQVMSEDSLSDLISQYLLNSSKYDVLNGVKGIRCKSTKKYSLEGPNIRAAMLNATETEELLQEQINDLRRKLNKANSVDFS